MKQRYITPVCELYYPALNTPDTRFNADGVYKVDCYINNTPEIEDFLGKLEKLLDDAVAEIKSQGTRVLGKMPLYDELEDGRLCFKFKQKAVLRPKGKEPITMHPIPVFDMLNRPLDAKVGSGSIGKVCFEPSPYYMATTKMVGLTFRLVAVQVKELKAYQDRNNGASFGFEAEEVPMDVNNFDEDIPRDF